MSMKKAVSFAVLLLLSAAAIASDSSHIQNNGVQITLAAGWNESLYAEWQQTERADSYHVYVKGGQYNSYTRIDDQLIRSYGSYNRADIPGLKAANDYAIKIVPVSNGQEDGAQASTATDITVHNFNRDGYAHHQVTAGIGAYNDDGTLKDGARILYISKDNAKTVTLSMMVDQKGKTETRTGIQDILKAYEKGAETRPLAIRIIGLLRKEDMPVLGSSAIGLQVKGKGQQMNLTLEGVGNDAPARFRRAGTQLPLRGTTQLRSHDAS